MSDQGWYPGLYSAHVTQDTKARQIEAGSCHTPRKDQKVKSILPDFLPDSVRQLDAVLNAGILTATSP
jgi:hypothetical protein